MTVNERDVELLHNNPHELVIRCQDIFQITLKQFIESGMLRKSEFEDLMQMLNEELLVRIPTIRQNYDGRVLLRTYIAKLATNACLKYYRDRPRATAEDPQYRSSVVEADSVTNPLAISEANDLFHTVLKLFGPRLPRLLVFLKLHVKIEVVKQDLVAAFPNGQDADYQEFLRHFGGDYIHVKEIDVFELAAPIINRMELGYASADSYRRWVYAKVEEICTLLNGDPPTASFDHKNVRVLIENYFSPFLHRIGYK
jgi:hypothetical protein